MAEAYNCPACPDSLHANATLLADVHTAFGFWKQHDFQNPNWWWNDIGAWGAFGLTLWRRQ